MGHCKNGYKTLICNKARHIRTIIKRRSSLVNRLPFSVKVTRKAGLYTVKIPKKVLKAPLQYCNQGPQFLAFWQNLAETLLKVKKTYLSVDRMTATRLFYY